MGAVIDLLVVGYRTSICDAPSISDFLASDNQVGCTIKRRDGTYFRHASTAGTSDEREARPSTHDS